MVGSVALNGMAGRLKKKGRAGAAGSEANFGSLDTCVGWRDGFPWEVIYLVFCVDFGGRSLVSYPVRFVFCRSVPMIVCAISIFLARTAGVVDECGRVRLCV